MIKRQGGIYFWRVGRIGGSFYLAKAKPHGYKMVKPRDQYERMVDGSWAMTALAWMGTAAAVWYAVIVSLLIQ